MKLQTIIILLGLSILTNCTSYDFSQRVVQQGNLLPEAKVARLKVGMQKNDVALLMGTSLISPVFNRDRWDYAYTWRRGSGPIKKCSVSLFFQKSVLVRIEKH